MNGYTEYLRSVSTIGFVGFLLALLVFGPLLAFQLLAALGGETSAVAVGATAIVALSVLALVADALWRRRVPRAADGQDETENGSIWDAIPSWQYDGLYAETGASTRGEQERALRETRETAAETERRLRKRSK